MRLETLITIDEQRGHHNLKVYLAHASHMVYPAKMHAISFFPLGHIFSSKLQHAINVHGPKEDCQHQVGGLAFPYEQIILNSERFHVLAISISTKLVQRNREPHRFESTELSKALSNDWYYLRCSRKVCK